MSKRGGEQAKTRAKIGRNEGEKESSQGSKSLALTVRRDDVLPRELLELRVIDLPQLDVTRVLRVSKGTSESL